MFLDGYRDLTVKGGAFGLGTAQTVRLTGSYSASNFAMSNDGRNGTLITLHP